VREGSIWKRKVRGGGGPSVVAFEFSMVQVMVQLWERASSAEATDPSI
jgi:hypothetical protein